MIDIVRLEDADAVAQPKGAEEDAPGPGQHDPGLPAALGEPVCIDINLLRRGYVLFDRGRLKVGPRIRARSRLACPADPVCHSAGVGVGVGAGLLHLVWAETVRIIPGLCAAGAKAFASLRAAKAFE
jgi:hypothetical protein